MSLLFPARVRELFVPVGPSIHYHSLSLVLPPGCLFLQWSIVVEHDFDLLLFIFSSTWKLSLVSSSVIFWSYPLVSLKKTISPANEYLDPALLPLLFQWSFLKLSCSYATIQFRWYRITVSILSLISSISTFPLLRCVGCITYVLNVDCKFGFSAIQVHHFFRWLSD